MLADGEGISRAEAIRRAVARYLGEKQQPATPISRRMNLW